MCLARPRSIREPSRNSPRYRPGWNRQGPGRQGRSEPGPNTKLWRILAGNSLVDINDGRVQLSEFVPKDVTIQTGDTVIWESRFFHSVTFVPTPPPPDRFLPERQPDGTVQLIRNPVIFNPAGLPPSSTRPRCSTRAPSGPSLAPASPTP